MRKKVLLLLIISILGFQQCNTTEPPIKIEKNPREYSWTIDTLSYPESLQTLMQSIWGSSSNDIYAVGDCDDIKGQFWHFNGTQWRSMYIFMGLAYTPGVVFGFSANDIWVAGGYYAGISTLDSAFIMHYDGSSWKRIYAYGRKYIGAIWGSSPNNIWFGGLSGTKIFHWDGVSIKKDTIPFIHLKIAKSFPSMAMLLEKYIICYFRTQNIKCIYL